LALSAILMSISANARMVKATFNCASGQSCVADFIPPSQNFNGGCLKEASCIWTSNVVVTRVDFEIYGTSPAETYWLAPYVVSSVENTAKGFYAQFSQPAYCPSQYAANYPYGGLPNDRLRATIRTSRSGAISGACYFSFFQ
jgi:hypothetical protein